MTEFTLHSIETAPETAKPLLEDSQKGFGWIPNLHAVMAESPETLEAYKVLGDLFGKTSLSEAERNVVWLTVNVEHDCHYCVPAHTVIAKMQGLEAGAIEALRNEEAIDDERLEALRQFTLSVVINRGVVGEADVSAFYAAGYTKQNVLDVILGVSQKVMSNYVNHFAQTPVDAAFASEAWTRQKK